MTNECHARRYRARYRELKEKAHKTPDQRAEMEAMKKLLFQELERRRGEVEVQLGYAYNTRADDTSALEVELGGIVSELESLR